MDHRKGYCCQIAVLHNCCENAEKLIWLRETFPFSTLFIKKYWMIYRWPGFHVVLFFGSSPPPPVSMLGRRHTGRLRNRGVRGWGGAKSYLGEGKPGPLYIVQYSFLFTTSKAFSPLPQLQCEAGQSVHTRDTMCVAGVVQLYKLRIVKQLSDPIMIMAGTFTVINIGWLLLLRCLRCSLWHSVSKGPIDLYESSKGPKLEIFGSRDFTQISPVWVGNLGTRPKNSKFWWYTLENLFLCFLALLPTSPKIFEAPLPTVLKKIVKILSLQPLRVQIQSIELKGQ